MGFINFFKKNQIKIMIVLVCSLFLTFLLEQFLCTSEPSFYNIFKTELSSLFLSRIILFYIMFLFLGCHWIFPIKKMYNWLFSKRYWISLVILLFLTVNQYHGSSIAMFDEYVQTGQGTEYTQPVLGTPRAIRSDEWLVYTPNRLSAQYGDDAYSQYNDIMRATATPNLLAGNMFFSYASLVNPFVIAIFLLGQTFGQSVVWYGTIILTFLVSIEMCMIISRKNKLVSVMGGCIIVFSGYYQWWLGINVVGWVLGAQGAIVCGYHFIQSKKISSKLLLGIGLGIAIAYFVTSLYPAWQVPVGYLFLGILIWIVFENRNRIKCFSFWEWVILVCSFLFAISLICYYFYADIEYLKSIMTTVYPGNRISTGGEGGTLSKLFWWFYNPLFQMPGKNFINPSEGGAYITLFPIPLIVALWYLIKEKQKDILTVILLIISLFLGSYILLGWPEFLAKITLMSYSTSKRAVDILGITQVYLLIAVLSRFKPSKKVPQLVAIAIIGVVLPIYILLNLQKFPEVGVPTKYIIFLSVVFCIFSYGVMVELPKRVYTRIIICLSVFALMTGIFVHPIQKGFDAVYSKPLSYKIQEIVEVDPKAKWLAIVESIVPQQFLVANGAATINSTNVMPNLELWNTLDPTKKYNDIYNRYSHVTIELTDGETTFELLSLDSIKLNLSYNDIPKTGVTYIYTEKPLEEKDNFKCELIYNEHGGYIYKIN